MGNIRYKSGEITKLLNISRETIRFYEKNGIVLSSKNEDNGYRAFHYCELITLQRVRIYNNLGFQLKESSELINNCKVSEISSAMEKNEESILDDIKRMQRLYEYSKELRAITGQIPVMLNQFRIENSPAIYHIKCQKERTVLKDKEIDQEIKKWHSLCPLVLASSIAPFNEFSFSYQAEIGFTVYEKDFDQFIKKKKDFIQYIPSQRSVYTIVEVDRSKETFYPPFQPVIQYLEKNRIKTKNMMITLPIALHCRISDKDTPKDYYQLWIPVDE